MIELGQLEHGRGILRIHLQALIEEFDGLGHIATETRLASFHEEAHHLGAHGEPWGLHVFAFRCLAGVVFGLIFWFRSLAHAVYAHTLYDLLVYARLL